MIPTTRLCVDTSVQTKLIIYARVFCKVVHTGTRWYDVALFWEQPDQNCCSTELEQRFDLPELYHRDD